MKTRMRDGTGHRHYRYLYEDTDRHGNVRIYYRRKGQPKIRISAIPGTVQFDTEYQLAFRGETTTVGKHGPATPATFRWLAEQYYQSTAFKRLDDRTRSVRKRILAPICERIGDLRFNLIEPRHIAKLRDEKAETPAAANKIVSILRELFRWACSEEYRHADRNPAEKMGKLAAKSPDGWRTWTDGEVEQYCARWLTGTVERLAMDLLLYTGARRSDAIRFGPQMVRDGYLVWTEFKGREKIKKTHRLPILPPLQASIDATPTGDLVFLTKQTGQPFSGQDFSDWFRKKVRAAGLTGLSAHGIRKFDAVQAAEGGATEQQLMALFGWSSPSQAALYTRKANREKMEAQAVPLLHRGVRKDG